MTRFCYDRKYAMQDEAVHKVSVDVYITCDLFPNCKMDIANQVVDVSGRSKMSAIKDVTPRDAKRLVEQRKRLSVRDLARKFERGLSEATKLCEEAKLRDVFSMEKHVLLKNLRDALQTLKSCVAGRNQIIVEDAISMVDSLTHQLNQREGELLEERAEMGKLMNYLKQASEDAKKLVNEERSFARAEIENAQGAVQRVERVLHDQEHISWASGVQGYEDLLKEAKDARRIKMLHQSSKVMDMESELLTLRVHLELKSRQSLMLQEQITLSKMDKEMILQLYELDGCEALGSYLEIKSCCDEAFELSACSIQWFRLSCELSGRELIAGATKTVYAPEPFDVGKILQADIIIDDHTITLKTVGKIDPAAGLGSYVEVLIRKHDNDFNVVMVQLNDVNHPTQSICGLHIGKMRIKLCKGKTIVAKEYYSTLMQLCGVRGGGNAAAQALFWQAKEGLSFVLAFESERERNAAIMLARAYALHCDVVLVGPGDHVAH